MYFSMMPLTTIGYGDITPVSPAARSLANLEGIIGQLYPAIILARVITLHTSKQGAGDMRV
ncbi:MAG TPA: potassium channel family protein [Acidocella sp.]|nr:potassium channel family protein [Acidocella sp.]